MGSDIEERRDHSPVLRKVAAGGVLVIAAVLAVKLVIGLISAVFWTVLTVVVVVAVLWAIKTLVW
jgi:hypothetical protein